MKFQLLILLFAVAFNLQAQTVEEPKTIFGNKKMHFGYFVNPSFQLGKIAGPTAVMPGIGAGVILNNKISLGLTYKYILTENTPDKETDNRLYLDQKYMGIKGEYSVLPNKVFHLNFPLEVGVGETEMDVKDSYENSRNTLTNDAWFAYLEPGVALEVNVWRYIKVNVTGSYRFISDVTFRNLSEKDFSGLNFSTGLKIGIF
jgi:hypothetical protein